MSYTLERFAGVTLPLLEAKQKVGTGPARSVYTPLGSGGAFDAFGTSQSLGDSYQLTAHGELDGVNGADLQAQADPIRALRGQQGRLYMRTPSGLEVRWVQARCEEADADEQPDYVLYWPVTLTFTVTSPVWNGELHGTGWTFDSGVFFDTGYVFDQATGDVYTLSALSGTPQVATLANGNAPQNNVSMQVTAGSSAVTSLTVSNATSGTAWTFSGTIAAGKTLIVDVGAATVLNDSVAAYGSFSWTADDWFRLSAGSNTVNITGAGGGTGTTVTFIYSSGYM